MKYVAALLSFLLMCFFVGFICVFLLATLYPAGLRLGSITLSRDGNIYLSVMLGIVAGLHSAKAALNPKPKKSKGSRNTSGQSQS